MERVMRYKKYITIILVILILLFAFLLRSNLYIHGDFNFFLDQARDMMLVKDIVVNKDIPLIGARTGMGGIFHGPIWLYMITPFFILSGGNPFATLVPLFLLVSLSIVAVAFFVGQKLYNTATGLFFALLLAMSRPLHEANTITTNAQVMPLIFLIYLFGIIKFMRGNDKYLILSMFTIALGIHFESAFSVFLIPLTLVAIVLRRKLPKIKYVLFGLGAMLLAVSNYILFELRHSFLMTQAIMKLFQGKVEPIRGYEAYSDIGFRVQDRANMLSNYFNDTIYKPDTLTVLLVLCVLIGAGVLRFLSKTKGKEYKQQNKEYLFILLVPVLYYALFVLYPMPLWSHYTLSLTVTAALLLSFAMSQLVSVVAGRVLVAGFIVVLLIPAMLWINQIYINPQPYNPGFDGSYKNQLSAAEKVFEDAGEEKFGYFQYSTAILTYNMDYLMWWVGKENGYIPPNEKLPTTYLIMYPTNASDSSAHEFWKKNVIKTNAPVSERWIMQGNIVVEKLEVPANDPSPDPNYYQGLLFR